MGETGPDQVAALNNVRATVIWTAEEHFECCEQASEWNLIEFGRPGQASLEKPQLIRDLMHE